MLVLRRMPGGTSAVEVLAPEVRLYGCGGVYADAQGLQWRRRSAPDTLLEIDALDGVYRALSPHVDLHIHLNGEPLPQGMVVELHEGDCLHITDLALRYRVHFQAPIGQFDGQLPEATDSGRVLCLIPLSDDADEQRAVRPVLRTRGVLTLVGADSLVHWVLQHPDAPPEAFLLVQAVESLFHVMKRTLMPVHLNDEALALEQARPLHVDDVLAMPDLNLRWRVGFEPWRVRRMA